jgi:hypothetical protein
VYDLEVGTHVKTDSPQARNLVVCMDGTGNAPKSSGNTNVLRLFGMLENSPRQPTFYTSGVGTRGDPAALTTLSRRFTKIRGLITGYGIRRDVEDAYRFLVNTYQPGDRIFIFGFSRGSFAALALTALLRLYGLLRPESENMIGRTVELLAAPVRRKRAVETDPYRDYFSREMKSRGEDRWWVVPVHFLGLFDTVKALKYFKLYTRIREEGLPGVYHESYPFTHDPENVEVLRHAVSLHDRRIPYDVFDIRPTGSTDVEQVWFGGVHSDVGGSFEDQGPGGRPTPSGLGRISLKWMVEAAVAKGLRLRPGQYAEHCTGLDANAKVHRNNALWYLVGLRRRVSRRVWRRRFLQRPPWEWPKKLDAETLLVHQSVYDAEREPPSTKYCRVAATNVDWHTAYPEGHIEPGQPLGQKKPTWTMGLANLGVSLLVWIAALAVGTASLLTWVGPLAVRGSDGMNLSFLRLLTGVIIGPYTLAGLGPLEFSGAWAAALFGAAVVLATLLWICVPIVIYGLIKHRTH